MELIIFNKIRAYKPTRIVNGIKAVAKIREFNVVQTEHRRDATQEAGDQGEEVENEVPKDRRSAKRESAMEKGGRCSWLPLERSPAFSERNLCVRNAGGHQEEEGEVVYVTFS